MYPRQKSKRDIRFEKAKTNKSKLTFVTTNGVRRTPRYQVIYHTYPINKKKTKIVSGWNNAVWIKHQLETKLPETTIRHRRIYIKKV